MPDTTQDKSEKPTPKKRQDAREEGQVAQSQEINSLLVLGASLGALLMFGSEIWAMLLENATIHLGNLDGPEFSEEGFAALAADVLVSTGIVLAPFFLLITAAAFFAGALQTKMLFSMKALKPGLNKINPVEGFKKLFKISSMVQLGLAICKLTVVAVIIGLLLRARIHWFYALMELSPAGVMAVSKELFLVLLVAVLVFMLFIGVLDYSYQRLKHEKEIRMTKEEVKEEMKRSEGDPEVRGRQDRERRRMSQRRMAQAVPEADVVVVNPTHYAVALEWDETEMDAPRVVAKGADAFALRIKKIAEEHGVSILERKLLARTLYESVDVECEIPPQLYRAVAEVLAFVTKERK